MGKVFHIGHGNHGDPESFSVEHFHDKVIEYLDPESTDGGKLTREEAFFTNQQLGNIRSLPRGAAFEAPTTPDEGYADALHNLRVEFQQANTSSLDIVVIADFDGKLADLYGRLSRTLQRWCVEACTENGWEIPFTQVTLHQSEAAG